MHASVVYRRIVNDGTANQIRGFAKKLEEKNIIRNAPNGWMSGTQV